MTFLEQFLYLAEKSLKKFKKKRKKRKKKKRSSNFDLQGKDSEQSRIEQLSEQTNKQININNNTKQKLQNPHPTQTLPIAFSITCFEI